MSSLEFLAKNVDKAIAKACDELNLRPDNIRYDILSHGSSGIFGLAGIKKAKIRVHLPEKPKVPVSEDEFPTPNSGPKHEISSEKILSPEHLFKDNDADDPHPITFEENPLDLGRSVLQRIVDSITSDAEISAEENSGWLFFNINGGNAGILIGKKGQTLDAIQSLVEKIVNKHNPHNGRIRVQVDVEGYLETRKANL
ncbi:MAG: Jag N-terminal domain-containing protein, partial [Deltaproteobacteria bacterium]|nr:Jag N-terminal domain-containing protein [Deltaproteobacteria bacterium]